MVARYIIGRSIDEPMRMERLIDENWHTYYYHTNALGTIAALTEWDAGESEETIVERYTYDAYGRLIVQTPGADGVFGTADDEYAPTSTVGNPYGFTARRLDPETGLMYYRARYYFPIQGRFISRDPEGYVDGMNLYAAYFAPQGRDRTGTQNDDCCKEDKIWMYEYLGLSFGKCVDQCYAQFGLVPKAKKPLKLAIGAAAAASRYAARYMARKFATVAAASRSAAARSFAGAAANVLGKSVPVAAGEAAIVGITGIGLYDALIYAQCRGYCSQKVCPKHGP